MLRNIIAVLILAISPVIAQPVLPFSMPKGISVNDYEQKTILIKVKPQYRNYCTVNSIEIPELQELFTRLNATVKKVFPQHQPPAVLTDESGRAYADLSLIYKITYNADADLVKSINSLLSTGMVEFSEPKYIPHLCFTPNDPQISQQPFLQTINAYAGWDISKGDTNTIIGIVDTGTDWDHPDLAPNLKVDPSDPINGIDDNNDSYIDNYRGWDLGENDNNPVVGNCGICTHGSHVSGCAAAATDNNTGVASPGFNCRFLPVKIANASGTLSAAYEGIVYAADHGCSIINCSWGGGGGGAFGQTIIDYATINKNSLVIAAAGNNGSNELFYPAAYNYVLAVAATNSLSDTKAGFSNYGSFIDVCAPGNDIWSTIYNDGYTTSSGTSMASPITAGVAGIVKSFFPSYNALQIGEQVRITTDNIYALPGNAPYIDKLGSGRINLLNALTITSPSVRVYPLNISDHNDNTFTISDTLYISGDITNYLSPTTNLNVTLISNSPYVTIIDNLTSVGVLGTMATVNNSSDPFIVKINSNTPKNTLITFKLFMQDGFYSDFQIFDVTVNVDYLNIKINDVWTSNTSKGSICYNGTNQTEGLGFDFLNEGTLAFETGFMAGIGSVVSDNIRGATNGSNDSDWEPVTDIDTLNPAVKSDFDAFGRFNDAGNLIPIGLNVNHRSYSWSAPPDHRYHIFEYTMYNASASSLNGIYAGIFSDWDIQEYTHNKANEDLTNKMGYVWCTDSGGYYAGIKLLTSGVFHHYAVDNTGTGAGGVDLSNGYSDSEKLTTLSTNRPTAGGTGIGNDVIDVVGTGPFNLGIGDSVTVAFALIAGVELQDLQNSAVQAQIKYDAITGISNLSESFLPLIYPNPVNDVLNIHIASGLTGRVRISLFDMNGRKKAEISNNAFRPGNFQIDMGGFANGIYLLEVISDNSVYTGKIVRNSLSRED